MSNKDNLRAKRYVKINPSRGYGDGLYEVVAESTEHFTLKSKGGEKPFQLYKAHTFRDSECVRATVAAAADRRAAASMIGRKK